jgi:TRAP-type C4-dicarboxylate transport system permease small subunit
VIASSGERHVPAFSYLVRAYDALITVFAALAGLMILFATAVVCADVLLRAVSEHSLPWAFEVTEFLLVYIPLLTFPWLARRQQHITIDVFTNWLPPRVVRGLRIAVLIVAAGTCVWVAYWGAFATLTAFERNVVNAGLVAFPRWALLVAIPVGFGLATIEFLRLAWVSFWDTALPEKPATPSVA